MFERSKYYGNALFKSIKKNSYKKAVQYSNKTQISEEQHASVFGAPIQILHVNSRIISYLYCRTALQIFTKNKTNSN